LNHGRITLVSGYRTAAAAILGTFDRVTLQQTLLNTFDSTTEAAASP
jgi:hypothetical protein